MSKIAIISDIHANLTALEAVLKDAKNQVVDEYWNLGDTVGYGSQPLECINIINKLCSKIIKGNHEDGVCNILSERKFSHFALEGVRFSRKKLSKNVIETLSKLPEKIVIKNLNITFCHGSYTEPSIWNYIDSPWTAERELEVIPTRICFVGHTHVPVIFGSKSKVCKILSDGNILDKKQKYIINVGSVGQPRDGDCRASYGIIDIGEEITFNLRRIDYDIDKTAKAMQKEYIDSYLYERLFKGE
jgi:predicted phosphodiesterase